jgi:hypothetical protein
MAVVLSIFGVAYAALCVWLLVRVINRRERWAKRMAAVIAALPLLYVVSFGPACWMIARPKLRDIQTPARGAVIFWPLGLAAMSDTSGGTALRWWMLIGVPDGYVTVAPQNPAGTGRFAVKQGSGPYN